MYGKCSLCEKFLFINSFVCSTNIEGKVSVSDNTTGSKETKFLYCILVGNKNLQDRLTKMHTKNKARRSSLRCAVLQGSFNSKYEEDYSGGQKKSHKIIGWTCVLIHQKVQLQNMNPHLVKQSFLSSDACFQERKGMFLHRNNQASMHTSSAHMISVFNRVQASLMLFQKSYTYSRQIKIMEYTFLVCYVTTLPWA